MKKPNERVDEERPLDGRWMSFAEAYSYLAPFLAPCPRCDEEDA